MFDSYEEPPDDVEAFQSCCKFCGSTEVTWFETPQGWRLFNDNGARHVCDASADFENLDDAEVR